jgi:hypothetical protein
MRFSNKELPFCMKTKFNQTKKTGTQVSYKRYSADEIKKLNLRLKACNIKDTNLTVIQDTTDLKAIFLTKLAFNKSQLSQKMFQF